MKVQRLNVTFNQSSLTVIDEQGMVVEEATGSVLSTPPVSASDIYLKNGADDNLPNIFKRAVRNSTILKRSYSTITSLAAGRLGFSIDGEPLKPKEHSKILEHYRVHGVNRKLIVNAVKQSYLYGGFPSTVSFKSTGYAFAPDKFKVRDYSTFRLSNVSFRGGDVVHDKHYYHRDWGINSLGNKVRYVRVHKDTPSWNKLKGDAKDYYTKVCYVPEYHADRSLRFKANRCLSHFIFNENPLSTTYPLPDWASSSSLNYAKADYLISEFDFNDIDKGFSSDGIIYVYHEDYVNADSGEAEKTFAGHVKMINDKLRGAKAKGSLAIVPVGLDGNAVNDTFKFEPTPTNANKERHTVLRASIEASLLSSNSCVLPELVGVKPNKSSLSESPEKLLTGMRLMNRFTVMPLCELVGGEFLTDFVNPILGLEGLTTVLKPNMSGLYSMDIKTAKHYLHPDQWFELNKGLGIEKPDEAMVNSGLIPAYRTDNN